MSLKVVLLDWGGVISPGGTPDELMARMAQLIDAHPDKIRDALRSQTALFKRGKLTLEQFWQGMENDLGHPIPPEARNVWTKIEDLAPSKDILEFVQNLKTRGYTVAILSNTFPNTAEEIKQQGWYGMYDPVILSSDIGMAKPDAEIYDYTVSLLGVSPDEIVFVDDQQRCLDPAAALGMQTVLSKEPQQVIADVSKLLS